MIHIKNAAFDDDANYSYVASHRKAAGVSRPEELQSDVLSLYRDYLARVMDREGPNPHSFSEDDHQVLKENYDFLKLRYFDPLRAKILTSAHNRKCPYCLQNNVAEIDHYLPKSRFGEYSIFSPNLVPICRRCNGRKLSRFRKSGGGRLYLHPYLDSSLSDSGNFLRASISLGRSVGIRFEVVRTPEMTDSIWNLLHFQFQDLGLAERYMEEAVESMQSMLAGLYTYFERGGWAAIADYLEIEQRSKEIMFGQNHWLPVMLKVLASSEEFCDGGFMALGENRGLPVGAARSPVE